MISIARVLADYVVEIADLKENNKYHEIALFHLLIAYDSHIHPLLKTNPTESEFREAFKQQNICDNKEIDMAIYYLLQSAPVFWKIFKSFSKDTQTMLIPYSRIVYLRGIKTGDIVYKHESDSDKYIVKEYREPNHVFMERRNHDGKVISTSIYDINSLFMKRKVEFNIN